MENGSGDPDSVEKFFGGKWFTPILRDIEAFENETAHFFPVVADVTKDEATDWVFQTLWNFTVVDAENNGLAVATTKTSRSVGTLVAVKWSVFEAYERAYPWWKSLKPEAVAKIDAFWWPGFVGEVIESAKEIVEKHAPRFREIRKAAMNLALERGGTDELDYIQGYSKGSGYLKSHLSKIRGVSHKREVDRKKRGMVVWFVLLCGEIIEKEKGNLR